MLDGMPAVFALPSTAGIICFNPGTLAKIGKKMPQNKKLTFSAVFDDGKKKKKEDLRIKKFFCVF